MLNDSLLSIEYYKQSLWQAKLIRQMSEYGISIPEFEMRTPTEYLLLAKEGKLVEILEEDEANHWREVGRIVEYVEERRRRAA